MGQFTKFSGLLQENCKKNSVASRSYINWDIYYSNTSGYLYTVILTKQK